MEDVEELLDLILYQDKLTETADQYDMELIVIRALVINLRVIHIVRHVAQTLIQLIPNNRIIRASQMREGNIHLHLSVANCREYLLVLSQLRNIIDAVLYRIVQAIAVFLPEEALPPGALCPFSFRSRFVYAFQKIGSFGSSSSGSSISRSGHSATARRITFSM